MDSHLKWAEEPDTEIANLPTAFGEQLPGRREHLDAWEDPRVSSPRCALHMDEVLRTQCPGTWGQCLLHPQHLVFFSDSWPCLCVLWPPAISQDPAAKTMYFHCSGVQHSPRAHALLSQLHHSQGSKCICTRRGRQVSLSQCLTHAPLCKSAKPITQWERCLPGKQNSS